jgi:hypothetical protein
VSIKEVIAEKFTRTAKKKNTIFVVSVKSITTKKDKVAKDMAKLLEEYRDVFSVKSPLDLLLRRREDDYAILIVPKVRLQAKNLYRLTSKERSAEDMIEEVDGRYIRPSSSL